VEHDREELALAEALEEWPVDVAYVLLEDVVEIAYRLVEMHAEDEAERPQLRTLREAEAPGRGRELRRRNRRERAPDTVERRLRVERNRESFELEQIGEVVHRRQRRRGLIVLESRHRFKKGVAGHAREVRRAGSDHSAEPRSDPALD
jgi:hypothetical protein